MFPRVFTAAMAPLDDPQLADGQEGNVENGRCLNRQSVPRNNQIRQQPFSSNRRQLRA